MNCATTCTSGDQEFDLDKCLAVMRRMQAELPRPVDCVVTTREISQQIKDHVDRIREDRHPLPIDALTICGLPVHAFPSEADARAAAIALAYEGKQAILVLQYTPPKVSENT